MPWEVRKRGGRWVVVNANTGSVKGTHESEKKAKKQLRALYANVKH